MAKAHRMTPKRRVALRKAQLASARKRKGVPNKMPVVKAKRRGLSKAGVLKVGVGLGVLTGTALAGRHVYNEHLSEKAKYRKIFVEGHVRKHVNTRAETRRRFGQPSARESMYTPKQILKADIQSGRMLFGMHERDIVKALKKQGY